MLGLVVNGGGVIDWYSDDIYVIDFSEYEARLNDAAEHEIVDIVDTYNHMPEGVFPNVTYTDMRAIAQRAVAKLTRMGFTVVWTEKQGIKLFPPTTDEDYGDWITVTDTGGFAIYDPIKE